MKLTAKISMMLYSKENKKVQPVQSTMRTFSFTPVVGVQTRSQHLADLVNRYKTK